MNWNILKDETQDEYIYRICDNKDLIGTWNDVGDIINKTLNLDYDSSAYRKKYQSYQSFKKVREASEIDDIELLQELKDARLALEKERKKIQTEKLELNRIIREEARDELFVEHIIDAIKDTCIPYKPVNTIKPSTQNERAGLLCFADCHFGKKFTIYGLFDEVLNEYSEDIFYDRMETLLSETKHIVEKEGFSEIHVFNLGDSLDGFIRHSQLSSLQYGVIDSAIIFGNYIADWLYRLSSFVRVKYFTVDGNHSELRLLDGKKGQHVNESVDKIIDNIIEIKMSKNDNFLMTKNKANVIFDKICDYSIIGVHGEVKSLNSAAEEYKNVYGVDCDYIFGGHLHHASTIECGTRSMAIGIGSIVGSDDYSMKLRRSADPSANFFVFEKNKGMVVNYRIVLN